MARFPVIKTMDQFDWTWPKKINQAQVKNLFRLKCIQEKSNVVLIGSVGVGKTHIATALGYQACLKNNTVLFTSAIDAVNNLIAAQHAGQLKQLIVPSDNHYPGKAGRGPFHRLSYPSRKLDVPLEVVCRSPR